MMVVAITQQETFVQVLLLAHQLHPDVLRRGASATLLDELRSLLEMGPSLSRGQPALAPQQGDAWGFHTSSVGPTVLGISDAITTMHNSIDWSRWRRNPAGACKGETLRKGCCRELNL